LSGHFVAISEARTGAGGVQTLIIKDPDGPRTVQLTWDELKDRYRGNGRFTHSFYTSASPAAGGRAEEAVQPMNMLGG
jgi:hypothetical protein